MLSKICAIKPKEYLIDIDVCVVLLDPQFFRAQIKTAWIGKEITDPW